MFGRGRHLLGAVLVVLVLSAGCTDFITGKGPLEFSANEATVSDDALEETGYSEGVQRTKKLNRSVEIGNQTRRVKITSHFAVYRANYSATSLPAAFVVLSTPKAEMFGQGLNPLGHLPQKTLINRAIDRISKLKDLSKTGNGSVRMLGQKTTLTTFTGTVSRAGTEIEAVAHVARVAHGNDYVIAVGIHAKGASAAKSDVKTLIRGVSHEKSSSAN